MTLTSSRLVSTVVPARPPLRSFLAGLDPDLSAREMHAAALRAGYKTTISCIYSARTTLGIANSRSKFARRTAPKPPLPPITAFPLPSDEAILEGLIVKIGVDRARLVVERVEHRFVLGR
jgi:hypothetical protein